MNRLRIISGAIAMALCVAVFGFITSCTESEPQGVGKAPAITLENTTGVYIVKVGKALTIEPVVENDEGAAYSWTTQDGSVLSKEKNFSYSWTESGVVYITFKVQTRDGADEKEIRVDISTLAPPVISLPIPNDGYVIMKNEVLELIPEVGNYGHVTYEWRVDGEQVSKAKDYMFSSDKIGTYRLSLTAINEDGQDVSEFYVYVKESYEMPFSWEFESEVYNVSLGRTVRLSPYAIVNAFDAEYIWQIGEREVQKGKHPLYAFEAVEEGAYQVKVTMKNAYRETSRTLTVNVCPAEGRYRRLVGGGSKAGWNKVYEYKAAPGQFINDGYSANTMAQAVAYAEERMNGGSFVSLGGFGGYIIFGFDHSIDNDGGYNFRVYGNTFNGSSEPGVVWVMQDENGDGLPNDTWYELKGSEYGSVETMQDYEITYYRPHAPRMPVSWRDNNGNSGIVDYLASHHSQDYYYPSWITDDSYTLRGTCLKSRVREVTPGYWTNDAFDWGYADNFSPIDRLTDVGNNNSVVNANHFRISDAVTFDGRDANLKYVDFVKIQTGVNSKAGLIGENSTEVFGVSDYNIIKK